MDSHAVLLAVAAAAAVAALYYWYTRAAVAIVASKTPAASAWQCLPGITTPVRLNSAGNVECASTDGVNCMWGSCSAGGKTATAWAPASSAVMNPLACGAANAKIYGTTGYNQPGHWCAVGCAQFNCGK